jgi:hypothetical protein
LKRSATVHIFSCLLVLFSAMQVSAAEDSRGWTTVKEGTFINEATLTHVTNEIHSLWVRIVPKKTDDIYLASQMQLVKMNKDERSLEYISYLAEIDCGSARQRKISTMFYNKDTNIIASIYTDRAQWKTIGNGGSSDPVYLNVCREFTTAGLMEGEY